MLSCVERKHTHTHARAPALFGSPMWIHNKHHTHADHISASDRHSSRVAHTHSAKALLSPPRNTTPFKCVAAVRFVTGSVITPFLPHPSLPHPRRPPAGGRKCYHTPWFITPPSWPLRASFYHSGYTRYHTLTGYHTR